MLQTYLVPNVTDIACISSPLCYQCWKHTSLVLPRPPEAMHVWTWTLFSRMCWKVLGRMSISIRGQYWTALSMLNSHKEFEWFIKQLWLFGLWSFDYKNVDACLGDPNWVYCRVFWKIFFFAFLIAGSILLTAIGDAMCWWRIWPFESPTSKNRHKL